MIIRIKDNNAELKFNIGFLRRLNEIYKAEVKEIGMSLGTGLLLANVGISQRDPVTLSNIIRCAANGFTEDDIDEYIEEYAEKNGELDKLFEEVKKTMGKSPIIKSQMKKMRTEELTKLDQ